ncbi:ABC transporter permease [Streptomyces hygroscopicus subsp. hygroscopicus]|uniref:ABC transporter permease n=1 Tax=Streptomyces sp. KHY 26 TaxID=3097359 RepID=UPI0024A28590|nr:ABC transporter permease [Streptomyces hygroscopicus]GLX49542.1 ABC transporter permease [Streptomyces hygroscopicus subsp. hygroscopicus]
MTGTTPSAAPAAGGAADALRRRPGLGRLRELGRGPLFTASVAVLAVLVLVALLAPLLAPYDPDAVDLSASLTGTSGGHLLGTDQSGRDILSRLIHGARTGLLGPLLVVGVSTLLGTLLGLVGAWRGGWADALLSRAMDMAFAIPGLLLAILLVAVVGSGMTAPVIAMAVAYTPYAGRLVRGIARQEKARPYIEAYRVQGWSGWTVCVRRLLPNIAPTIFAQSAMNFGYALMDLAALSFLGFGVQPPTADWGAMINEGQSAIQQGAMLPALAPSTCIVLAVVAFGIVGEGLADRISRRER